jgi:hypothetical protein
VIKDDERQRSASRAGIAMIAMIANIAMIEDAFDWPDCGGSGDFMAFRPEWNGIRIMAMLAIMAIVPLT